MMIRFQTPLSWDMDISMLDGDEKLQLKLWDWQEGDFDDPDLQSPPPSFVEQDEEEQMETTSVVDDEELSEGSPKEAEDADEEMKEEPLSVAMDAG